MPMLRHIDVLLLVVFLLSSAVWSVCNTQREREYRSNCMEKWFGVSVWMRTRKGVTSEMNMDVVCFASLPGGLNSLHLFFQWKSLPNASQLASDLTKVNDNTYIMMDCNLYAMC